ncbi:hypothetical protein SAMN04515661_101372 [Candidatus Frackibacter sp. WG11]|uniref:hypothetical protein n=1 Tax=Candidatus Frackibacter sp. WG11 TaxID=2017976 RepID=UPI00087F57A9|nr:hypothetical protein [Candidatus Frackibacter sp. WG11]SDC03394.1 hypothetical protein SAMN04515661_101372 [Candidatus Frackibacter sp. WG11]
MKKKSSSFSLGKGRLVLIIILILISVGFSGFMSYQILNITDSGEELAQFRAKINQIVKTKDKKVTVNKELKEILSKKEQVAAVFTYNNDYSTTNPFKSLLEKKPVLKVEDKDKVEAEVKAKPKPKSKPKSKPEPEPKPKRLDIKVIGLVGNETNKRAFLEFNGSESYMVREGQVINGLVVKKITSHEIIIAKEGTEFSYHCGGDSCENIDL